MYIYEWLYYSQSKKKTMVYNNNMHTSASLKLVYQNALAWPKKFAPEVETHFTLRRTIRVECNFFSSFLIRNRGAHFQNNFSRFGWVLNISNNFWWGFQKCRFHQRRTHPVDAKVLATQPTYRLSYRLHGQKFSVDGVCLIKKSRRVLLLELKN